MGEQEGAKRSQGVGDFHKEISKLRCPKIYLSESLDKISYQNISKNGSVKRLSWSEMNGNWANLGSFFEIF